MTHDTPHVTMTHRHTSCDNDTRHTSCDNDTRHTSCEHIQTITTCTYICMRHKILYYKYIYIYTHSSYMLKYTSIRDLLENLIITHVKNLK